ncbi:hypothetical protein ACWDBD_32095 [Streptomyces sp. NPDC001118]
MGGTEAGRGWLSAAYCEEDRTGPDCPVERKWGTAEPEQFTRGQSIDHGDEHFNGCYDVTCDDQTWCTLNGHRISTYDPIRAIPGPQAKPNS